MSLLSNLVVLKSYFKYYFLLLLGSFLFTAALKAQYNEDTLMGPPPPIDPSRWGPNDTIITPAIYIWGDLHEWMSYRDMDMVWVSKMSDKQLEKYIKEWTRLRNAVYVTYPYARTAGHLMNDINMQLKNITSKRDRKDYIKTREKELKAQFADPLSNLSVYQGKILMKLINRQTGNSCYEIVKEYRGGVTARVYQTVAFFFGSSLKQDWDLNDKLDKQIENIVREIDASWYNTNYRQAVSN